MAKGMIESDRKEALSLVKDALENFLDSTRYESPEDEVGTRTCCGAVSYKPHTPDCTAVKAAKAFERLAAEPEQDLVNHDAPIFGLETKFDPALTIQEGVKRMATAMGWRPPASDDPPAEQWKKPEPEPVAWTTLEELQNIRRDFTGSIWGRPKIHELGEVALYLSPPLRELSEEEIEAIKLHCACNHAPDADWTQDFARAILEAARRQP